MDWVHRVGGEWLSRASSGNAMECVCVRVIVSVFVPVCVLRSIGLRDHGRKDCLGRSQLLILTGGMVRAEADGYTRMANEWHEYASNS